MLILTMNTAPMTDDFAQTILQFEITHNALQKIIHVYNVCQKS